MDTKVLDENKKLSGYTAEERFRLITQSPLFVKKRKDAEAFIKRVGLPEWHPQFNKQK